MASSNEAQQTINFVKKACAVVKPDDFNKARALEDTKAGRNQMNGAESSWRKNCSTVNWLSKVTTPDKSAVSRLNRKWTQLMLNNLSEKLGKKFPSAPVAPLGVLRPKLNTTKKAASWKKNNKGVWRKVSQGNTNVGDPLAPTPPVANISSINQNQNPQGVTVGGKKKTRKQKSKARSHKTRRA